MMSPARTLAEGEMLGGYEVVAPLRLGGMASLYRARRVGARGFTQDVAIKTVHPELAHDGTYTQMLVDEALMASRIRHPNVVRVEELADDGPICFLVMEYVDGWSLGQLMDALVASPGRLPVAVAAHIAIELAAGLHAAHEATREDGTPLELVHRDVSPPNVLLSCDGHVKLIDFGVAKARGRTVRTTAGTLKGKFRYMAPEQARGGSVDRRTDVYAAGILLWEMLTMRPLFGESDELELLMQVRDPTIVRPGSIASDIPPELDAVVLAALALEPDDRPATAQELRRRLLRSAQEAALVDSTDVRDLLREVMGPSNGGGPMGRGQSTVRASLAARER